jgi:hypothetical protein
LIHRLFHIRQSGAVAEYVEHFFCSGGSIACI